MSFPRCVAGAKAPESPLWRLLALGILLAMTTASCSSPAQDATRSDVVTHSDHVAVPDVATSSDGVQGGPAIAGFDFELRSGMLWEFNWQEERQHSSGGRGGTTKNAGILRIGLGAQVTIDGITGYELQIVGGRAEEDIREIRYLATSENRLLGSTNGVNWEVLFDANTGRWAGRGLFTRSTDLRLFEAHAGVSGFYEAGVSENSSNCEYFEGIGTICGGGTDSTYWVHDLFAAGRGIQGYRYKYSESDYSSGGDWAYNQIAKADNIMFGLMAAGEGVRDFGDWMCGGCLICASRCGEGNPACLDACWALTSAYGRIRLDNVSQCTATHCRDGAACSEGSCRNQYDACFEAPTCAAFFLCSMRSPQAIHEIFQEYVRLPAVGVVGEYGTEKCLFGDAPNTTACRCLAGTDDAAELRASLLMSCVAASSCEGDSCFNACREEWDDCLNDLPRIP